MKPVREISGAVAATSGGIALVMGLQYLGCMLIGHRQFFMLQALMIGLPCIPVFLLSGLIYLVTRVMRRI
jgi:hypothetical protein